MQLYQIIICAKNNYRCNATYRIFILLKILKNWKGFGKEMPISPMKKG